MSFNTWYKPFSAQKIKDDGNPQEPDMQYCNIEKADGTLINVCQENIMKEIMTQIEEGFQVIFLQEFTSRIQEVFDKCKFSDEYVGKKKQIPFTMAYTPSGGGSSVEYYVYSVTAQGESMVTLCSKTFFPAPVTQYYMGNLTGYPNNPSYASDGDITQFWDISGGGRPYIVLVFDDKKMILINIHGPHGDKFNSNLQKIETTDAAGKKLFTAIKDFKSPIDSFVQTEIDRKNQAVNVLNGEYENLQDYTFRQLGDMLRKRIPEKLKEYNIIFAGDFNMRPDEAKRHLVKLSEILSTGNYGEGPFSNSSGVFDKQEQNNITLTIGDTKNISTGTCCVEHKGGSYGSGVYDQIYSNKLKVTKYWTYNGNIEYDKKGGILFSDHLPVYAEIELPESATSAPVSSSSGGSKRFTLRNNNNNNNKPISRKIRKHASTSMPTTRFTKKHYHSKHSHNHNKKHKTRRSKH
jgi:endonuclease/exonuclease/phosphatase family metal-dependent hydrolase